MLRFGRTVVVWFVTVRRDGCGVSEYGVNGVVVLVNHFPFVLSVARRSRAKSKDRYRFTRAMPSGG